MSAAPGMSGFFLCKTLPESIWKSQEMLIYLLTSAANTNVVSSSLSLISSWFWRHSQTRVRVRLSPEAPLTRTWFVLRWDKRPVRIVAAVARRDTSGVNRSSRWQLPLYTMAAAFDPFLPHRLKAAAPVATLLLLQLQNISSELWASMVWRHRYTYKTKAEHNNQLFFPSCRCHELSCCLSSACPRCYGNRVVRRAARPNPARDAHFLSETGSGILLTTTARGVCGGEPASQLPQQ